MKKNKLVLISSMVLIITGVIFIGIQLSNTDSLLVFYRKHITIVFNSCLCLTLIGAGYMLLQFSDNKKARAFSIALSLLLTVICILTISEHVFNFDAGIDGLFVPGGYSNPIIYPSSHGQMLPATAVVYLCLGLALLGFCTKIRFVHVLSQYFLHIVSVFCSILLIGFAYSGSSLANMATHALNYGWLGGWLITLSIAASFRHPSLGLTSLFSGTLVGNKMARRLFAMMAASILVFGLVKAKSMGFTIWQYDSAISLFVFCILVAALLIIWHTANWLNKVDLRRIKAENELKALNAELGKRVDERTVELSDLLEKYMESEIKFRTLVEKAIVGVYIAKPDTSLLYVNQRFAELFGYEPQELIAMEDNLADNIYDKKNREILMAELEDRRTAKKSITHFEIEGIKKNGASFWVEVFSNIVTIKGQTTSMGMLVDITERKRIEIELREAEMKFRTLVEKSIVGVYISTGERFLYINPRFAEIFGYEPQEIMDMPGDVINTLYGEESRDVIRANIKARYNGEVESAHYEVAGIKKDGTTNYIEFYGNIVTIDGQSAIIGTMLDITGRKQAGEIILKEKELSATIINSLPGIFYLRDENGRCLRWNKNLETATGRSPEEIEGTLVQNLFAEEDQETLRRAAKTALKEGYGTAEIRLVTKDGRKVPYLITKKTVTYENQLCFMDIGIDISQRIKAEEELKISEQKYKLLFESNPLPLWIVAKDDMTVMTANAAAAKLYGYRPEELLNMEIKKLRPGKYWDPLLKAYQTDIHEATDFGVVEHIKKDGTQILVNIIAQDIIFEGRFARISSTNDVTEKLKAEEELRLSEQKYKMLFENNPSPLTMIAKDDLSFIAVNEEAAALYGYDKDELLRTSIKALIPKDDVQKLQERFDMDVTGSTDFGIIRQVRRDLSTINVRIIAHDFIFEGRPVRLSMIIDITERLKAEELLRQSEARFRSAFENASIGVALVSLKGEWMQVNRTLCEMLGYREDELLKLNFQLITHPDDLGVDLESLRQILNGETENYTIDKRYIHKDGSIVWANLNVSLIREPDKQPSYFLSVIENITEKVESQRKFQNLVEDSIVGVYILQNGRLVYVNPRIIEETGYSEEETIGKPYEVFIFEDDREFVMNIIDSREKGLIDTIRYEARVIKKDGQPIWYEIIGSTTIYRSAPALIGTMVDITERKAAEKEIYRLTRLYQFVSSINESMLKAGDTEQVFADACRIAVEVGRFQMAWIGTYDKKNDRTIPVTWSGHEDGFFEKINVAGMKVSKSVIPSAMAIRERTHFYYNDIANDPDIPSDIKHEMIKRGYLSGLSFPILVDGEIVAVMVLLMSEAFFFNEEEIELLRDVTDNITYALDKIKIQALKDQSEANLRSIFDTTEVNYMLLDTNYDIVAINQQSIDWQKRLTGRVFAKGVNVIKTLLPEKREATKALYDKIIQTNQQEDYETSYLKDGAYTHFLANVKPIHDGKKAIGICITGINITTRKNAVEQLKQLNENLLQQAKELAISNTELEEFAYVASHDLQEPLRMITSFLTQLERKYSDILDEKAKKYIYFATDGAKRMRQIILDLLEYSRVGRTEDDLEDVDFNALMDELLPLYRRSIEELKAKVHVGKLPVMHVYKTPVRQVFQNLLGNALKYHNEGIAPLITVSSKETQNDFEFSVKDNGIGIDPEYFNQIFIIFKRLHNRDQYPGTGMGLAITKKIIENMGGRIWVDSLEGAGSVFHFTIPKHTNK